MLPLFISSAVAYINFDQPYDSGWYEPGTFDVQYNSISLSHDALGTFAQLDIGGSTTKFQYNTHFTHEEVKVFLDLDVDKTNRDIAFVKVVLNNPTDTVKRARAVFKSDINIIGSTDVATKLNDDVYYFDNPRSDKPKYVFNLKSSSDYIGPKYFSYGAAKDDDVENYYTKNDRPDTATGDLYVSYAWDYTEIPAQGSVTFGIKMQFTELPQITVQNPQKTVYSQNEQIVFSGITVTNSQSGTLTVMLDEQHKVTQQYSSTEPKSITFVVPNELKYSPEERALQIFADDSNGFSTQKLEFFFTVKNSPILEDVRFIQGSAYPGDKIQLSLTVFDKDTGKNLNVFAKAEGKEKNLIKTFQSNGDSQTFKEYFTVPDLGEDGYKEVAVWISDKSTSTEESDDGPHAKSSIMTTEFDYKSLPKLDITYPTKKTYQRGEKIHLVGTISSTGITMKFKIDNVDLEGTRSFTKDSFDFELAIPVTTKFGEHTLDVIIVDSNHREVIDDNKYKFTYSNTAPVFRNVKLEQETVKAGSKTKIVGEVRDVDVGSFIVITASYGENKQKQTTVNSDGEFQKFEIEIETDDSMKDKTIEIEVKASDNIAFTINDPNLKLKVTADQSGDDDSQKDGKGKLTKKEKMIIGIVVPLAVIVVVAAIVAFIIIKKKSSADDIHEDGYLKETNEA